MKAFIDTDVILDFLYQREKYYDNALTVMSLMENGVFEGYISALIVWNLFYILSKYIGEKEARKKIKAFCSIVHIIPIDAKIIETGLNSGIKDFEDAVQYYAAENQGIDVLITRNKKDYPKGAISIVTPAEFITSLGMNA